MKHTKLSITLEPDVADELRQVAGPRGISAYVNEAVRLHLQAARLQQLLDELDVEYGPVPDDVKRQVAAMPWTE